MICTVLVQSLCCWLGHSMRYQSLCWRLLLAGAGMAGLGAGAAPVLMGHCTGLGPFRSVPGRSGPACTTTARGRAVPARATGAAVPTGRRVRRIPVKMPPRTRRAQDPKTRRATGAAGPGLISPPSPDGFPGSPPRCSRVWPVWRPVTCLLTKHTHACQLESVL